MMALSTFDQNWKYLIETTLATPKLNDFNRVVSDIYVQAMAQSREKGYIPSVSEVADMVDSENILVLEHMFRDLGEPNVDMMVGNYIDFFVTDMESWVEDVLIKLGYPYLGCSIQDEEEIRQKYSPQNILFIEFLRRI